VAPDEHRQAAQTFRELMAVYRDHEDLISIGAYRRGSNPAVDLAIDMQDAIKGFLRQNVSDRSSVEDARKALVQFRQQAAQRASAAKPPANAPANPQGHA
jgi:flagellum-specific ATP synthase